MGNIMFVRGFKRAPMLARTRGVVIRSLLELDQKQKDELVQVLVQESRPIPIVLVQGRSDWSELHRAGYFHSKNIRGVTWIHSAQSKIRGVYVGN